MKKSRKKQKIIYVLAAAGLLLLALGGVGAALCSIALEYIGFRFGRA